MGKKAGIKTRKGTIQERPQEKPGVSKGFRTIRHNRLNGAVYGPVV